MKPFRNITSGRRVHAVLLMLAGLAAVAGCDRMAPDPVSNPPQVVTTVAPPKVTGSDASLPDAATVLAAEASASAGAGSQSTNQRDRVTPGQESRAMPLPGQANDHSNTVADPKPGS